MSGRPNIFGANIAQEIYAAMGADMLPATLTRTVAGARDPSNLAGGQSVGGSTSSWSCRGFVDSYRATEIDGTIIRQGDRKVLLLGKSLPDAVDPRPGDVVAIEGEVWKLVTVDERDPAGATFICQARR